MAINDDLYWYKNVLKRTISTTIRFYLSLSIILSPIILIKEANAADQGDWWLQREIKLQQNREDYARRVYGRSARSFTETDPATARTRTVTKIAIAEASPSAGRVGASMLQRVAFYAKNPGVQMVGVIAVTQLIEGIGWVMEDGTYVKKKMVQPDSPPPNDPSVQYFLKVSSASGFPEIAGKTIALGDNSLCASLKKTTNNTSSTFSTSTLIRDPGNGQYYCKATMQDGSISYVVSFDRYANPNYNPSAPPPQPTEQKIPLTSALLGAAMMGEGYSDPVDPSIDSRVNTGQMDNSVADAYNHAGNGVGDELANEMDDKLKNAPQTPDGKPAPFGDLRFTQPPTESAPNINDRGWTTDGGTADGTATPVTDPSGNPTGAQSITVKFPVFCEWAFTVCKWYDDWKTTDQWMKEEPEKKEPEKVEFDDDASAGKVTLTGSEVCPQDSVEFTVLGKTYTYQLPYQPVCDALSFFKPAVLAVGAITSAFIVAGINVKGEE